MGLFVLTVGAIIIGASISKANARRRARQAYAARVAMWREAQAEKARIAYEREQAKREREEHRRQMDAIRLEMAQLRLAKATQDANARQRVAAENRKYIDRISPAWGEHTEILAEYAGSGKKENPDATRARLAALNAEKQYHAERVRALKAG